MKRSIILIVASFAVIGIAYFAYWCVEPTPPALAKKEILESRPLPPAPNSPQKLGELGPGHAAWMVQTDPKTGEISSRFRSDEYKPQKNGTVLVSNPISEFFLAGHQHLEVVGLDGEVVVQDVPNLQKTAVGKTGMPNRGRINHVTMKLIDDNPPAGKDPLVLTLTTNNIAFDNETFRITTEPYTAQDGSIIAADQVPVHVVGDYEFDGRGLTLRWNDRDGRLELLEIAHGERLVINHPGSGGITPGRLEHPEPAPPVANTTSRATSRSHSREQPAVIEVADSAIVNPRPATQPLKPNPAASETIYAATFYDAVKVTQGEPILMTGDSMRVNFRLKGNAKESAGTATRLATTQQSGPTTAPTTAPALATTKPSTQPAEIPVVVTWTGKLRIVPTPNPPRAIAAGDAVLEMFGSHAPAFARRAGSAQQEGLEARGASLLYQTSDGSASLYASPAFPTVTLTRLAPTASTDTRPSIVTSHQIDYTGSDRTAILRGEGHATFPLAAAHSAAAPPSAPATLSAEPKQLDATWDREGKLIFSGRGREEMTLDHASFTGNVDVEHSQLSLQSQSLELQFAQASPRPKEGVASDPEATSSDGHVPATQPATRPASRPATELRRVIATGEVHTRLTDSSGKKQWIECAKLDLRTAQSPEGKIYPRQVFATGDASADAHAYDESQDLRAGDIQLTLRPSAKAATRPTTAPAEAGQIDTAAVELEKMTALQRVRVVGHDGGKAFADELDVAMVNDEPHVMLTGQSLARVEDAKQNLVTGPRITFDPKRGDAHVEGPGNMHMVQVEEPAANGPATRPATQSAAPRSRTIDVIWSDHADIDNAKNAIDVYGKVISRSPDSDGAMNSSESEHVHIDLRKKLPAPQTRPAVAVAPTTRPAASPSPMQMDLFKDKEATLITLDQNASVNSTTSDAAGKVLRQFQLQGPKILYALVGTPQLPAHSLLVPSAGEMLVRDHRAADPKAKKDEDAAGMGSGRGATAFKWSKLLLYNEDARRADITGNVLIVHRGDDPKDLPARITAEHVTAWFQPAKKSDPVHPAAPADQAVPMELKLLTADDSVFVTRGTEELTARHIDLDPATHWLAAYGADRDPAVVTNTATSDTTSADQIDWNTQTWDMKFKNIHTHASRPGK